MTTASKQDQQEQMPQVRADDGDQPQMTNLHVIRDTNLLDVPAVLRNLAAAMENGDFGTVNGCVVVWDSEEGLDVSYSGTGEAAPNAHLLLHAGAAKMMQAVMDGKL